MPSVRELSALYENFMVAPRRGPGACQQCCNLTDGHARCYACAQHPSVLAAIVPISYSIAREQLHHALATYKRPPGEGARRLALQLAAVLWRFLQVHESCIAYASNVPAFPLVTTVPSGDRDRDERHPLHRIVSELVGPTRDRFERLLRRSEVAVDARVYSAEKFLAQRPLDGEPILLIDDTWTTGANAQSAAAALRQAGAGPVGACVIGRHVNRDWGQNHQRLGALTGPFDWNRCVSCGAPNQARDEATAA